jgi:hypothetical protein
MVDNRNRSIETKYSAEVLLRRQRRVWSNFRVVRGFTTRHAPSMASSPLLQEFLHPPSKSQKVQFIPSNPFSSQPFRSIHTARGVQTAGTIRGQNIRDIARQWHCPTASVTELPTVESAMLKLLTCAAPSHHLSTPGQINSITN